MNKQNESTETNETSEMKKTIVRIGYHGNTDETRPVKFTGLRVAEASNYANEGDNQNRYHEWVLYKVRDGYRVYDVFCSRYRNEANHYALSELLNPAQVAKGYPALSNEYFDAAEVAEDLDEVTT